MKYITHKRFKHDTLQRHFNIPAMTECDEIGGIITHDGSQICHIESYNAHQYFARNDDGNGMLRGELTQAIQKALANNDENHQARWDKVWDDPVCQPYKRKDHEDFWLWNHDFYNASIEDLQHIAALVGAKAA